MKKKEFDETWTRKARNVSTDQLVVYGSIKTKVMGFTVFLLLFNLTPFIIIKKRPMV